MLCRPVSSWRCQEMPLLVGCGVGFGCLALFVIWFEITNHNRNTRIQFYVRGRSLAS
jgi:H+/Cl- antiporter ClcA